VDNVLLNKPSILIHSCCAICSIPALMSLEYDFKLCFYYSNSNLDTYSEFEKRLNNYSLLSKIYTFDLFLDAYDNHSWNLKTSAYKDSLEKGKRCELCIYYRLERSFLFAKDKKIDILTSTLSSSPYKSVNMLFSIAKELEDKYNIKYLYKDFKKKDGFKLANNISKKNNLYIQNYCGCVYSKKG